MLKDRITELKATRDQARLDAERAEDAIERGGPAITPQALKTFARTARKRMRTNSGGYRRDHLRALAQRVEVDQKELRIMGSKSALLRTLVAASSEKTAGFGVPSSVPKWRARNDSNIRPQIRGLVLWSGPRHSKAAIAAFEQHSTALNRGGCLPVRDSRRKQIERLARPRRRT